MTSRRPFLLLTLAALSLSQPALSSHAYAGQGGKSEQAGGHGKGQKGQHGSKAQAKAKKDQEAAAALRLKIGYPAARQLAQIYKITGLEALPPGIQKNMARGKPIPPGLAKKEVPEKMLERLPRHEGCEWRIYGADLVLVTIKTSLISDVLVGVFR